MALMTHLKSSLWLCAALVLTGCASVKSANESTINSKDAKIGLPSQKLAPNECATFVWTADDQKRFILFSKTDEKYALWDGPKGIEKLKLISISGLQTQKQYPQQFYGTVKLNLLEPQAITNGTRYRSGTLKYNQEGWTRVTSVVGVTACQQENDDG